MLVKLSYLGDKVVKVASIIRLLSVELRLL
jgi:hypothetical protein